MDLSALEALELGGRVGRATGKAILVGEHFVVHGGPALAVPVAASITVTLEPSAGWSGPEIAQRGVQAMLEALGLSALSARLGGRVDGDLPLGAGLGGSAALAAALLRALGLEEGPVLAEHIHRCEKVAHGRPSGLDGLTVAMGRPVWMPEVDPHDGGDALPGRVDLPSLTDLGDGPLGGPLGRAAHAEVLALLSESELPLMVAVVPREGTTRGAVAQVAEFKARSPERFAALARETAELARAAKVALERHDWPALGRVLDLAHGPLAQLDLVSASQAAVVTAARQAGALGAKLSGAGLGGAVVICHTGEPQSVLDLESVLRQAGAVQVFSHKAAR